ncbi:uroporphyrinogen-III synthase [Georgenia sp. Z1491]|uniref:uroporphyrinogen-III synthase n=1 Tax=Georgenia sp. Z1491 TaxID=3416707 RepID=UPI003CEA19FE
MSRPELGPVLAGCTIVVTADRRANDLAAALGRRGADVRHAAALSMIPTWDDDELRAATERLVARPPDVVVVTTGIGFRAWLEAADAHGLAGRLTAVLSSTRLIARGPKARGAIQAAGLTPDWVTESETSAEITEVLTREGVAGLRIAVQLHGAGADGLDAALAAAGAEVVLLAVYRWGPSPDPRALEDSAHAAASGDVDAVVFTSAPGAEAWLSTAERLPTWEAVEARYASGDLVAAAVGEVTAGPLRARGITPLIPDRGRLGALIRGLVAHFSPPSPRAAATIAGPLEVRSGGAVLSGELVPLTSGGRELLRLLIAHGGRTVDRAALLEALPAATSAHAAEVAIARLREALAAPGLISTVVKRGYTLEMA